MNHYPRHLGDYATGTQGFSQGEHGAYGLLIDAYYAAEAALPAEDVYAIGKATNAAERKNVEKVLARKFELRDGRYFHKRVEQELDAYRERAETARVNGKKGGRKPSSEPRSKPKPNPEGTQPVTGMATQTEPSGKLASSHKPENPQKRFPDISISSDSVGSFGAAALAGLKGNPVSLEEARIPGGGDSPAAALAAVLKGNGLKGNAFHPLVVEWSREGVTVDRLKDAIAKARQRPGKETGVFGPEYLDPILHDLTKPAAEVHAERASKSAAKNVEKAQSQIAEQSKWTGSPMPEHLRPRKAADA